MANSDLIEQHGRYINDLSKYYANRRNNQKETLGFDPPLPPLPPGVPHNDLLFAFFALTILSFLALPVFLQLVRYIAVRLRSLTSSSSSSTASSSSSLYVPWSKRIPSLLILVVKAALLLSCAFLLRFLILQSQAANPLRVLGLDSAASLSDIKRAYYSLSKQIHPDKNKDPQGHIKFQELRRAYESAISEGEKSGDGPLLAVALPEFMSDPNNHFAMLLFYFVMLGLIFAAWRSKREFLLVFAPVPENSQMLQKEKHSEQARALENAKNIQNWSRWRNEDNLVPDDTDEEDYLAAGPGFFDENDRDLQEAIQASLTSKKRNPFGQ